MLKNIFGKFEDDTYEAGLNLYSCGCTGEILRKDNKIFTSVSDDTVHNIVLTLDGNELVDSYCDCSAGGNCEHVCCAYISYLENGNKIQDLENITDKLSNMKKSDLKLLLERTIMFNPSIVEKLNICSNVKDVKKIISEMKLIISTIDIRKNNGFMKIENIIKIYMGEADFFEKMDMEYESFLIYSNLLEELKGIISRFDVDAKSISLLSILYDKLSKFSKIKNKDKVAIDKILMCK